MKGVLKEKKQADRTRLMLVFDQVQSVQKALECLTWLQQR
jgi:hypothetical protein